MIKRLFLLLSFSLSGAIVHSSPVRYIQVSTGGYANVGGTNLFINVKDYGAKSDGTDSRAALQAAFNAATSSSTILIPAGQYIFGSTLTWPSVDNVTIIGYGATLKLKNSANTDLIVSSNYPSPGGGQSPKVIGLTIDGNRSNNSGNGSVAWYGINNGNLADVTVQNAGGVGFFFIKSSTWVVSSSKALSNQAGGFVVYNGARNIEFNSCHAISNAPNFLLEGSEVDGQLPSYDLRIIGGSSMKATTGQSGIQIFDGVVGFVVSGMTIGENSGRGIDIYSGTTTALTSNYAYQNKNGVISGNTIFNNDSDEGIKIWDDGFGSNRGPINISISGNRIYDYQASPTQNYGIVVQSSANYISIIGNNVVGNGDPNNNILVGSGSNANGMVRDNLGDISETYQTRKIVLIDNSTGTVANSDTPLAFLTIISDLGYAAGISLRGGFNSTAVAYDATSQYSVTGGNANKTNVFYDAGLGKYRIENKTGSSRIYSIFYYKQ